MAQYFPTRLKTQKLDFVCIKPFNINKDGFIAHKSMSNVYSVI